MANIDAFANRLFAYVDNPSRTVFPYTKMVEFVPKSAGSIYSTDQMNRVDSLLRQAQKHPFNNPHPTSLFPFGEECFIGTGTIINYGLADDSTGNESEEILLQLLPYWLEETEDYDAFSMIENWGHQYIGAYEISSKYQPLLDRIRLAKLRTSSSLNSRATQFSRSAHYMGSKAFLAPYLAEIVHTLSPATTVVLDLMCGSGAASGYFSREWRTLASDAQEFSRLLAKVQGGGLNGDRAATIAESVLTEARRRYSTLPDCFLKAVEIENDFLSSELTPDVVAELYNWISKYPRVNNIGEISNQDYCSVLEFLDLGQNTSQHLLFSTYYANLFFGVRQAAEIDCLRGAIDQMQNAQERDWALGALICATSSCAYSYGGHFAQPKYDGVSEERLRILATDLIVSRGLSVSHEFFVRLTSLGEESEKNRNEIESLEGPWQIAIEKAGAMVGDAVTCVYLDPPYTRDEYSRYYHILETLVRYDYPSVQDKASMPKRGQAGRFASAFATRNTLVIEDLIVEIIEKVLSKGWSCLWSYSSTGVASVEKILQRLSKDNRKINVFGMTHSYKGQGKHKAKAVREYAVMVQHIK
ncbi:hypothetical protein [Pseudomonas alabamensis]|uniref:hypothetical protein n=1 Tax=Pseudomonas alabamensis TaxID=3064349 RepID=UPI003F653CAC